MSRVRVQAWAAAAAFVALVTVLAAVDAVSVAEAALAAAAAGVAMLPSGWLAPAGWGRRAAEAALLPAAYALTMTADPTMRRMIVPPLLVLAGLAAAAAAVSRTERRHHPWLVAALALAVRLAGGLGLLGVAAPAAAVALLAPVITSWALARWAGAPLGIVAALLAGALPLESHAGIAAAVAAAAALLALLAPPTRAAARIARGWLPGAVAFSLLASAVAPWGGVPVARALPSAGWPAAAGIAAACALTPVLPTAAAGAVWLGAAALCGPVQPPPPDRAAVALTAAHPAVQLPPAGTGVYLTEVALANAADLPAGTVVATVAAGSSRRPLRAGVDAAEWAHERPDVRARVAHPLPRRPVWRPSGLGAAALWGVAGQVRSELPAGAVPVVTRADDLPAPVTVSIVTAGPARPTPPRSWPLPAWLLGAAAIVALLQLAAGTWKGGGAWVPWALLGAAALAARASIEPLRLLAERHAVDVALAALLAAWLPAARAWLRHRRAFLAAAALLVPLALATPHLFPPGGDEQYHLIILRSLARDHDLDLTNNYDLGRYPENHIYMTGKVFLHSPVLAAFLLPGYLLDGRAGALVLLALGGAGLAALLARRAAELGCPPRRVALLMTLLLLSYPLATFSTQIWVEVPGALCAIAAVMFATRPAPRRGLLFGTAALASAAKARLALVTFPLLLAAWSRRKLARRELGWALLGVASAGAVGLGVGWLFLGSPLGMRRLPDIVPHGLRQPIVSLGGLVFDPAGGLVAAAPWVLVALLGIVALWRRGTSAERLLVLGGAATVLALLHSTEWYGGGSPPARYLVPLLPIAALAGAQVLTRGRPWRPLALLVAPAALLTWWVYVTRPHLTFNSGEGGYWLADVLARRFAADARHLFPSFLRVSTATYLAPALLMAAAALLWVVARRSPATARAVARSTVAISLVAAAGLVWTLHVRDDRVVEIEDPQVTHDGGALEPPLLTFGRYRYANGWRVSDGQGVVVPLHLPAHSSVSLEGWVDGQAGTSAAIEVSWDGAPAAILRVAGGARGRLPLPPPPASGRHELSLGLRAPAGVTVVFDRVVVRP